MNRNYYISTALTNEWMGDRIEEETSIPLAPSLLYVTNSQESLFLLSVCACVCEKKKEGRNESRERNTTREKEFKRDRKSQDTDNKAEVGGR